MTTQSRENQTNEFQFIDCSRYPATLLGREMMSEQLGHNWVPTKESQPLCQGMSILSCPLSTSCQCWDQPLAIPNSTAWLIPLVWMGTLYRHLQRQSVFGHSESLGLGNESLRLCPQIKAQSADKTQLSVLHSCWIPTGVKEESWVFVSVSFYSCKGACKYLVKKGAQWECNPCATKGIHAV